MTLNSRTLTRRQVCEVLGISDRTFYRLRDRDPSFPKPIASLSLQKLYFDKSDVDRWIRTALRA